MAQPSKDIKLIFAEALEKQTSGEQAAYLDAACGNDTELLKKVEALLTAYAEANDVPDSPIIDLGPNVEDMSLLEQPGTIIGSYKLLELIGEGGFGAVYMAEQEEPIRRRVALKIIKLGMDTKQVIARFEAERQALAMMDHPNIAKVFDAGSTDKGRPYFAMELVKGVPITEYCDENNLETQQRLGLFIDVCRAVEHAHQKGIIHRDIKPSNVMVTLHDGRPVPKIIDFGIAKAMAQPLTEKTLFTEFRQLIGTPEYMSPEQAEFSGLDVDVRTDVYSLGVLLYELLTGTTPFERDQLRSASFDEICRIIRVTEPLKPSARLSRLGDGLAEVAKHRRVESAELCKNLRGDLDWIVMKTLEKDRTRRYESSHELAADIERHLADEPVLAGPPSAGYRLHKFVRRNRVAVITFLLVAAALAIGATTATIAIWNSGGLPGKIYHAAGMGQRHVWDVPPNSSLLGGISRDGRYLSYVDWTAGNLAVYDLTTQTYRQLTKNTDPTWDTSAGSNESSTVSHDGKRIAYSWFIHQSPQFYDLRIIDVDGTNMRVLFHDPNAVFCIIPYDFSPDSKNVLAYFSDAEKSLVDQKTGDHFRKGHLVLVSVADGSVRTLKTWQRLGLPKKACFSPDGRYVAYDFVHRDDLINPDIFLIDLVEGGEVRLIDHPANDRLCGWTPDGRSVVFLSDRSSTRDLWMIDVTNGLPRNEPRKLVGSFVGGTIGFTTDGSLYYSRDTSACNVYLARLDASGLNFDDDPRLVSSQFVGSTVMGDWSPDGSLIAYRIGSGFVSGRPLAVYSIQTSEERLVSPAELFTRGSRMWGPRWSPDGKSLLVSGIGQESGHGLYKVDVKTGLAELILSLDNRRATRAVWSPDGTAIYLRSPVKLNRLDLASRQETELCLNGGGLSGMDISPDGRWLAFYQGSDSLVILPSLGGEPREVVHLDEDELPHTEQAFLRWTPDGEHLLFSKGGNQMWKVHVKSGAQQQIGPTIKNLMSAAMHPDGRQIAFTVQQAGSALWVMENFLPE